MGQPETDHAGFSSFIGMEYIDLDPGHARARIEIKPDHLQPYGTVHGGIYGAIAESLCSAATNDAVRREEMVAIGQSNSAVFLRPITEGHVNALARTRHRGRTTWIWDVELSDDDGQVCALVRMTVAVRPQR